MEFSRFRLDSLDQCLWRRADTGDDDRIPLTPKAFAVLQYLVEHAGRLVTQGELLEALWPQSYVQPEVLKHHVLEVRKALGDDPKKPLFIETLPRRGYRFIAPVDAGQAEEQISAARLMDGRLVGRDAPLAALREFLGQAIRGQRQIIFVTGEPGIGKSAMVDQFRRRALAEVPGLRVALGQCVEGFGSKEGYYPMLEALGQLCRGPAGGQVVDILATQAPTWLVQFPPLLKREHRETLQREILGATRERMLREIGDAIESITAAAALLLVFEDLQWVDHSTVDLISALARSRTPARLMLVATSRSAESAPADDPMAALRQDLVLHRLAHEIALQPLGACEVTQYLVAESSPERLPAGLAEAVHRHSGGNPLFMVAALDHLTRRGFISREKGHWQLAVPLEQIELGVPENLRQMIEAQIERLSTEEKRALEVASVAGAVFSAVVSATAVNVDPDNFESLFETVARQHRMLRRADTQQFPDGSVSPRYEFVHALYREVLYQRQPLGRRSKLHRRIGERLEALYTGQLGEAGPELAHHFTNAGDWPRVVRYLRLAADTAMKRFAHEEAADILRHTLDFMEKLPEATRAESEIQILEALATIYFVLSDLRAIESYEMLAARAARYGRVDVQIRALIGLASFPLSSLDSTRAQQALQQALRLNETEQDPRLQTRVRLRVRLACSFWQVAACNWVPQDMQEWRQALAQVRSSDDAHLLAVQLIYYSFIQWCSSEYAAAHRSVAEGLAILERCSGANPFLSPAYHVGQYVLPLTLVTLGQWGDALKQIDAAISVMQKNGDRNRARRLTLYRAWIHLNAMDFAGVLAICDKAVGRNGDSPSGDEPRIPAAFPTEFRISLVLRGSAEMMLGEHQQALEHLCEARDAIDRDTAVCDWYWRIILDSSLTQFWLASGDLSQARAQAERFIQRTSATAERMWQALAWEAGARVAMAEGDRGHAQHCIATAVSTMQGYDVPLAAWRVHATAAELCGPAGDREAAMRHGELSRATILRLADSLQSEDPLRTTFLSAPSVSRILAATLRPGSGDRDVQPDLDVIQDGA